MNALKLATKEPHALKIEDLDMPLAYADEIVQALKDFADELGYSKGRIKALECRRRDGFIPYSHNKGGIEANAFMDQYMAEMNGTGFENCDKTLEKYRNYDLNYFLEDRPHLPKDERDWDEATREAFDEYRMSAEDATVLFSVKMILNSESELNLVLEVCCKDSPYHRQYDDQIDISISFKSVAGLKRQLNRAMKRADVKKFSDNLSDAF